MDDNNKKNNHVFLKILGTIGLALLFGTFGGATLFGCFMLGEKLNIYHLEPGGREVVEVTVPSSVEPASTEPESIVISEPTEIKEIEDIPAAVTMDVSDVAAAVMPSMVSVLTTIDIDYYGYREEGEGSGSGFIVGESETELLIATNYHVIENGKKIEAQFNDGSSAEATVKGKNIPMDVAVIAVTLESLNQSTKNSISIARLGNSDDLEVGEPAIAIGNALGYGQSVTTGVISALNREQTLSDGSTGYFIQTDAAINPGNSGGALLNMEGKVIGINSSKLGGDIIEGMGYAIPISVAQPIIEELSAKKTLMELAIEEQSYLGISGADVKSGNSMNVPSGVYVSEVFPASPALNAGMQKGDVITKFDGDSIADMADLKKYLASYVAGSTVPVTVMRIIDGSYQEVVLSVTLGHVEH